MKNFEELLQKELDKLPYTKHLDDGQYNDGKLAGFELGARWALSLFDVSGLVCIHPYFSVSKYSNSCWCNQCKSYIALPQTDR